MKEEDRKRARQTESKIDREQDSQSRKVKQTQSGPARTHKPLLACGAQTGQLLADLLHLAAAAVVAALEEPSLGGEALEGLQEGGGAVLEGLVAVDHCHLDQLLHILGLSARVLSLQLGELLIEGVEGNCELDVLQDGGLGLHELLQRVLLLREHVELADGDRVDLVELGGGEEDGAGDEFVVVVGEEEALEEEFVEESEGDEEGAAAELEVPLRAVEPVDAAGAVGAGGDGLRQRHALGAGLRQRVLAPRRDVPDVLDQRVSHRLHFRNILNYPPIPQNPFKPTKNSVEFQRYFRISASYKINASPHPRLPRDAPAAPSHPQILSLRGIDHFL